MKKVGYILLIILIISLLSRKFAQAAGKYGGHISLLNRDAQERFSLFLNAVENLGYKVVISSGKRDSEEQDRLHEKNSKNAPAGTSKHEEGKALDISISRGGKWWNKKSTKADWQRTGVPQLADKLGIKWGGNFKNYHDPVHFYID